MMQAKANDFRLADEECWSEQRFICLLGERLNCQPVSFCYSHISRLFNTSMQFVIYLYAIRELINVQKIYAY